jgi:hypothetical protein
MNIKNKKSIETDPIDTAIVGGVVGGVVGAFSGHYVYDNKVAPEVRVKFAGEKFRE